MYYTPRPYRGLEMQRLMGQTSGADILEKPSIINRYIFFLMMTTNFICFKVTEWVDVTAQPGWKICGQKQLLWKKHLWWEHIDSWTELETEMVTVSMLGLGCLCFVCSAALSK